MELFQVTPEECLYFGDTNTDMAAGHNAGSLLWACPGASGPEVSWKPAMRDRIIDRPGETFGSYRERNHEA